jgi:hypothetical protein
MQALLLCDDAMRLILRVLGGNGLREGGSFERRYRDFQAMPLHINAHRDRIGEPVLVSFFGTRISHCVSEVLHRSGHRGIGGFTDAADTIPALPSTLFNVPRIQ